MMMQERNPAIHLVPGNLKLPGVSFDYYPVMFTHVYLLAFIISFFALLFACDDWDGLGCLFD
jgi:hypothetical protein